MSPPLGALLTLVLACGGEPAPEAPIAPPPVPSAPPEAAPVAPPTPASALHAVGPSHQGRVPSPLSTSREIERTLATLGKVVDARATDPNNPWAVAHGLLARGPDLVLRDGRPAVDALFADFAQPVPGAEEGLLQFPESRGEIRIEPHADLVLKNLADVGLSPERTVQVGGETRTLADLWRGSVLRSYLVPATNHSRYSSPDDIAWSLQGIAAWAPPDLAWTALDGTPMRLDDLADFGLAVLVKETRFLAESRDSRVPFQRKGQGIFRYTCGGAHLLQGVAVAVARGFGRPEGRQILAEQVELQLYRFPIEAGLYRQAIVAMPEHEEQLLVQRLKFSGHYLETMAKLQALGLWTPQPEQRAILELAVTELADATAALQARGSFDDLDALRARDAQLYLDIVGDSSHAIYGLDLILGKRELRW